MLLMLAWRNLWRRPQRTLLSLASIIVYAMIKENTLRIFDSYTQFQATGYAADPAIDRVIEQPQRLMDDAASIDGITAVAPRVNGVAIVANGERSYGGRCRCRSRERAENI